MKNPIPEGMLYLDNAATTPIAPEVLDAMMPYLTEKFGNPATLYSLGGEARQALENAREQVAALIDAQDPSEVVFNSGGSESDNWAIRGVMELAPPEARLACSAFEHHAVLDTCQAVGRGREVLIDVDSDGIVRPDVLRKGLPTNIALVSIMHSNNEIGTIQPIKELCEIAHEAGALFHTDAVQSVGKIPFSVRQLGVDLASMSGHKLNGPKGIGAMYIRKGTKIAHYQTGGGQEQGRRGGTVNVAGAVGFGKAAEIAKRDLESEMARITAIRDRIIDRVLAEIPDSRLNGSRTNRLPQNAHFSFKGTEGESILLNLDMMGICCSAGAACSSGEVHMSHVLRALGLSPEWGHGSLRVSFGRYTNESDIDRFVTSLSSSVEQVRRLMIVPNVTN